MAVIRNRLSYTTQAHLATVEKWTVEKTEVDQESVNQWRWMRTKNVGNLVVK